MSIFLLPIGKRYDIFRVIILRKGVQGMRYRYETKGTCSRLIEFTVEDGIVKDVKYTGGCSGNLQGISKLVDGMKVEDVIEKLRGIGCGMKGTSCPDQLSKALEATFKQNSN